MAYKEIGQNLLILSIALFIGILLMEFVLRMVSPPVHTGVGTSQTEKANIYGWAPISNSIEVFINPDTGKKSYFKINSHGWKDVEHQFKKPSGVIRLLFLGDSITYGVVGLNDLYTRKIESLLIKQGFSNVEVISMGVGGWGTDQELEALEAEGLKYEPDFVIYEFSGNDVTDILKPEEGPGSSKISSAKVFKYRLVRGNLAKIKLYPQSERTSLTRQIKKILLKSAIIFNMNIIKQKLSWQYEAAKLKHWWDDRPMNAIATYYSDYSDVKSEDVNGGWMLLEALIVRMKAVSENNKSKFLVFSEEGENGKRMWNIKHGWLQTEGTSEYVVSKDGRKYPADTRRPLKKLKEICERNGIPLIEPKREYARYEYDCHPNGAGNEAMAQDVVDFLVNWEPFLKRVR